MVIWALTSLCGMWDPFVSEVKPQPVPQCVCLFVWFVLNTYPSAEENFLAC